jgi:hypothetical protein
MRTVLVSLVTLLCVGLTSAAQAERRTFVIINDSSYGVDNCLAKGDKCGAAAANVYCRSRRFAAATSYRKVDRDDITGAIPTGGSSGCGAQCGLLAIVCTR